MVLEYRNPVLYLDTNNNKGTSKDKVYKGGTLISTHMDTDPNCDDIWGRISKKGLVV